ncbi:MAG: hypothetical protein II453_11170 [Alphaproteobacteria bacterium]|nr:hypothetical protein [Alphaproteobacteria bacterium]
MKDKNIYVFICAKSHYGNNTFEYSGTYGISKNANLDDVIDHITKDMNKNFGKYLNGITLPRAAITSMNEISKELYDRLRQEH